MLSGASHNVQSDTRASGTNERSRFHFYNRRPCAVHWYIQRPMALLRAGIECSPMCPLPTHGIRTNRHKAAICCFTLPASTDRCTCTPSARRASSLLHSRGPEPSCPTPNSAAVQSRFPMYSTVIKIPTSNPQHPVVGTHAPGPALRSPPLRDCIAVVCQPYMCGQPPPYR